MSPESLLSVTGPVAVALALWSLLFEQPATSNPATAHVATIDIKRFRTLSPRDELRHSLLPPGAGVPRDECRVVEPTVPAPGPSGVPFIKRAVLLLVWAERAVFFAIGIMLFAAAIYALVQSGLVLFDMLAFGHAETVSTFGSRFLDAILLVLMIVELAYTVILSLRGAVLQAEPFLIVGLIAVIRRILVITVGEAGPRGTSISQSIGELGILTAVVIVFVGSIVLLRLRPARADEFAENDPLK